MTADVHLAATPAGRGPVQGQAMDTWKCLLTCEGRTMSVTFHMGPTHGGRKPTVNEVLTCLLDDVHEYRQADGYRRWAAALGMDPDDRSTEQAYVAVGWQADRLTRLLGEDRLNQLTYE